jgi:glycosyltransferase involved in cell wall biosynthesis
VRHRCIRNSLSASAVVAMESLLHHRLDTYKRHLDRVVVPSRFFIDKFIEWGWPREKFSYIPNYVEAADFVPEYVPGDSFLYFGRLVQEKGVETLLRAAAISGRVKLRIAGSGPLESSLHQIRQSFNADISFLGHRSGADLHAQIRQARAVVLPSEWYENAPLSILESYALGKPVIGARIGGIPEMVIEGETGWTFTSGDRHDLARVLEEVATMPDAAIAVMGRNARAFVERRFNRAAYTDAMLSLYAELGVSC